MHATLLLIVVILFYAGYNLLTKVSGDHVPVAATSTILATNCLQIAALAASSVFLLFLVLRGGQAFALSNTA